jgi:hypothetical protein
MAFPSYYSDEQFLEMKRRMSRAIEQVREKHLLDSMRYGMFAATRRPVLEFGSSNIDALGDMATLLSAAGHPTTPGVEFGWHHYTRVLQFQLRCCKDGRAGWDWKTDIDGKVGPQTWAALEALGKPQKPGPFEKPPIDIGRQSPNRSERGAEITHIILHNTAGGFDGAVSWLCNRESSVSAHLVVSREAATANLVPLSERAWHAGSSRMNACSIGIEIEATDRERGMTAIQEARVIEWVGWLMKEYNIPASKVLAHRMVSSRTDCPVLIWPTDDQFKTWRKAHFGG